MTKTKEILSCWVIEPTYPNAHDQNKKLRSNHPIDSFSDQLNREFHFVILRFGGKSQENHNGQTGDINPIDNIGENPVCPKMYEHLMPEYIGKKK